MFFMENVMGFVFGVLNEIGWVVKGGVCFFDIVEFLVEELGTADPKGSEV